MSAKPDMPRKMQNTSTPTTKPQRPVMPAPDTSEARQHLDKALTMAREGSFKEAYRLAKRAAKAMPTEAEALSVMIDYAGQYADLADQARKALNGSSDVDLGKPWGTAPFVSQTDDSITFFIQGKHKRFTIEQFNGLAGVRFRVTRDFLDRAATPANDLIIGSYQFLIGVNENGDIDPPGGHDAAHRRIRKAIMSGDPDSVKDGASMIKVLDLDKKP